MTEYRNRQATLARTLPANHRGKFHLNEYTTAQYIVV